MNVAQTVKIARFSTNCTVLGPGRRGVVWFQGCDRKCPGCTAPETWSREGGTEIEIEPLVRVFTSRPELEGLTLSGGEPFLQSRGAVALIEQCRARRPDFSVLAFTGFTLEELLKEENPDRLRLLALLDVLVDGPYRETEHMNLLWRGSQNQRVWFLTPRYEREWRPRIDEIGVRIEMEMNEESVHFMGIPPKNFRIQIDAIAQNLGLKELK